MTRLNCEYVDGWPFMSPLGEKEFNLLQSTAGPDEEILGVVIGQFNQTVVATAYRVIFVKTGITAGQTFGGKATSFDYGNIVGVEIRTRMMYGDFVLISAGLPIIRGESSSEKIQIPHSPNGIEFFKSELLIFQAMATKIRERTFQLSSGQNQSPSTESIPDAIRKIAELHKSGILSDEEFQSKKAELLKRL